MTDNYRSIELDLQAHFGFKFCFNPAMIPVSGNRYLLVCRLQNHPSEGFLGICYLDKDFRITQPGIVIRKSGLQKHTVMLEDPRIFSVGEKIFISHVESSPYYYYNSYTVLSEFDGTDLVRPVVPDYKKNKLAFIRIQSLPDREKPIKLPQDNWVIEKNWQFFSHQDDQYFIYRAGDLHEVIKWNSDSGTVIQRFLSFADTGWNHGRISGGANPVLVNGDYYSFFHSWTEWDKPVIKHPWQQRKYHIGIYVFESKPPFRIKYISKTPLLSGSDTDEISESGHSVVFPGSAHYEESTGEWIIALGWNDISSRIMRFNHQDILKMITPVKQKNFLAAIARYNLNISIRKIRKILGKVKRSL